MPRRMTHTTVVIVN